MSTEYCLNIDISAPGFPDQVGHYDTTDSTGFSFKELGRLPLCADPEPSDTYCIYVSDTQTGLHVLRFDPNYGVLDGTVTDAVSGDPIEGAMISVPSIGRSVQTDADGYYHLCFESGTYDVDVNAFAYAGEHFDAIFVDDSATLNIVLNRQPVGLLHGHVTVGPSGVALAGADVSVIGTDLKTVTLADGSFALPPIPTIPVSSWTIDACKLGYGRQFVVYEVNAGESGPMSSTWVSRATWTPSKSSRSGWIVQGDPAGAWQRGDPVGTGGGEVQPETDHTPGSGALCFATGLSATTTTG